MRIPCARVGVLAAAVLTAALLLGAGMLSLRVQAARPAEGAAFDPAAPAETTRVYVDPVTSSVDVGDTLVLSIAIEGAEDLNAYQFDLSWDPAVFAFTSAADASFLEEPVKGYPFLPEPGTLIFGAVHWGPPAEGASGDGVLATVTLQATGGGTSTLDLDRVSLIDTAGIATSPDVVEDGWAESACEAVRLTGVEATTPVEVGQAMSFTATATGSEPIGYTWDFGGAGTPSGEGTATPSYVYDAVGLYTVTVTATNPCDVDQASIAVEVTCDTAEISDVGSDSPVQLGETMHFTASVAGMGPITYTWDFDGDGAPEREGAGLDVVTYTYPAVGAYTVTLVVDNVCGVEDEETLPVRVTEPGDLVYIEDLTYEGPAVAGKPVTFTASVTGSKPITYTWDFDGDGSAERVGTDLAVVTHTYSAGGAYTVTLGVENVWNADSRELALDVCEPVSVVTLASDGAVPVGQTMHFTATVTGTEPIGYTWDVDSDGSPEGLGSDLNTFTHVYTASGTYTATLTVENACGDDAESVVVRVESYTIFVPLVLKASG